MTCLDSPSAEHEGSESLCEWCLQYVDDPDELCADAWTLHDVVTSHSVRADVCVWCLQYDVVRE